MSTGGPAFPSHHDQRVRDPGGAMRTDRHYHSGMTLHDYYVGEAIRGLTANPEIVPTDSVTITRMAQAIASEAIKARGRKTDTKVVLDYPGVRGRR